MLVVTNVMNSSELLHKKKVSNLRDIVRGYKAKGAIKAPLKTLRKADMVRAITNLRARGIDANPRPAAPRGVARPPKTPAFKKRPAVGNTVLAAKTVAELRSTARELGIRGTGSMKKAELIRVIMISRTPVEQRLPGHIRAKLLERRQKIVPRETRREMVPYVAQGYKNDVARARISRFEDALRHRAYAAGKVSGDVVPNHAFLRRDRGPVWRLSPIKE